MRRRRPPACFIQKNAPTILRHLVPRSSRVSSRAFELSCLIQHTLHCLKFNFLMFSRTVLVPIGVFVSIPRQHCTASIPKGKLDVQLLYCVFTIKCYSSWWFCFFSAIDSFERFGSTFSLLHHLHDQKSIMKDKLIWFG